MTKSNFLEEGRLLFAGPCDFFFASASSNDLPSPGAPEIAFAGRSNVGKSSLLNALTNRKSLARVSNTPGRTQQLNFFSLSKNTGDERIRLVDMPGYGYAAVGKEKIANWSKLMRDYLRGRAELARVYVLIDGRRGVKPPDEEMLDLLDQSAVSYQVILTKYDELTTIDRNRVVEATMIALAKRPAAYPEIIFTSSQSGEGIGALRESIARLLNEISA